MKKFFGGTFIEKEKLQKEGIFHPIKLEYYKIESEDKKKLKYGLEIIKTDYYQETVNIEKSEIRNITNDENSIQKILEILKENDVTPVGVEEVVKEILVKNLQIIEK